MARGDLLIFLQDDELPPAAGACELIADARRYFEIRPRLGLLSLRGGDQWFGHWYGLEGPSAPSDPADVALLERLRNMTAGLQYVTAGYPTPVLVRRSAFMQARARALLLFLGSYWLTSSRNDHSLGYRQDSSCLCLLLLRRAS